jgi:hypothetical protein
MLLLLLLVRSTVLVRIPVQPSRPVHHPGVAAATAVTVIGPVEAARPSHHVAAAAIAAARAHEPPRASSRHCSSNPRTT